MFRRRSRRKKSRRLRRFFADLFLGLLRLACEAGSAHITTVNEIAFRVDECVETGGFVARWDAPGGGGITTQGDTLAELHAMIIDAIKGYFGSAERPRQIRLHFLKDPVLAVS